MNSKRINKSVGTVLSIFSIAVYLYANQYKGKGVNQYGPNFFPQVLAVFLFIASVLLIVSAFKGKTEEELESIHFPGLIRSGVSILISVLYLFLMQLSGFLLATVIFLFAMMTYLGQKGMVKRIISTLSVSVIIYAIFYFFLKIPLPLGIFQKAI